MAERDEPDVPNAHVHATAMSDEPAPDPQHIPRPRLPDAERTDSSAESEEAAPGDRDDGAAYADLAVRSALESATMELPFLVETLAAATRRARAGLDRDALDSTEVLTGVADTPAPTTAESTPHTGHSDSATSPAPSPAGSGSFRGTARVPTGQVAPSATPSAESPVTPKAPEFSEAPSEARASSAAGPDVPSSSLDGDRSPRLRRLLRCYGWLAVGVGVVAIAITLAIILWSSPSSTVRADENVGRAAHPGASAESTTPPSAAPSETPSATPSVAASSHSPQPSPTTVRATAPAPAAPAPSPTTSPPRAHTSRPTLAASDSPTTTGTPVALGPWNDPDRRAMLDAYCEATHGRDADVIRWGASWFCVRPFTPFHTIDLTDACAHRYGAGAYVRHENDGSWRCYRNT